MKPLSELRQIGLLIGLSGGEKNLRSMARACGVPYHTVKGWWYYSKRPEYPTVEKCKDFLLSITRATVADPAKKAEIEAAVYDLYRKTA